MTSNNLASRKHKLIEVDSNRENLYNLCIDNALTLREISSILKLSLYKIKSYVAQLVRDNHMKKIKYRNEQNNKNIIKFESTETAYNTRSMEQIDDYLTKSKSSLNQLKKGLYDDLIASNPNLRKISLFDTKPTKDFLSAQKLKVNRHVSSSWSMFESH